MKTTKNLPLFRSLVGAALLCAGAFTFCAAIAVETQGQVAFANLYLVNTTSDAVVLGACQNGDPGCSLRDAIQTANAHPGGDGIVFDLPAGSVINLTTALPDITDSVNINGPGADKLTVQRNASALFRIFNVTTTGTVNFSGLTIAHGATPSDGNGGGIQNVNGGTVNVTKCVFSGNAASSLGGGIASQGILTVSNSTLTGNLASGGGGIYHGSGTATVTNSTLSGNSVTGILNVVAGPGYGGAIRVGGGTLNVANSTLSGNSATGGIGLAMGPGGGPGSGGALFVEAGTLNVTNSTLSGNSANGGQGINGTAGGTGSGGAVGSRATVNITNSTISGNSATAGAGSTAGQGTGGGVSITGNAAVKSTIVAKNTATTSSPDVSGFFESQGFNLIGKNDGSTGFNAATDLTGTVAAPLDPKFGPLQYNGGPTDTLALLSGSPAIDKGTSSGLTGTLTTDQRGVGYKRTVDKSIGNATGGDGTDIGAFEFGAQIKAVSRKTHGTAGSFNVNLPLFGPKLGVECRTGGNSGVFKMILTFPTAITLDSTSVTPDPNAPSATASVSSSSVSGSTVTVNLTGVSNAQTIFVTLSNVSDGTHTNDVSVPMGVLLGDTTNNGSVTSSGSPNDVTLTQSKVGQSVTSSTFREDVTVDGVINSTDVNLVQSKVGTKLP